MMLRDYRPWWLLNSANGDSPIGRRIAHNRARPVHSLDQLVGKVEHAWRHGETERLGGS